MGGIRWRHLWPIPFVLAGVLIAAIALLEVPPLRFGWWTALGGIGNPVTGTTDQTAGTTLEWLIPLVFILLLVPALPLFAFREEELFRLGAEGWSGRRRVLKAVQFGLMHALIGIPIAVALALGVGGGYFQWAYLRGYRASGGDPARRGVRERPGPHRLQRRHRRGDPGRHRHRRPLTVRGGRQPGRGRRTASWREWASSWPPALQTSPSSSTKPSVAIWERNTTRYHAPSSGGIGERKWIVRSIVGTAIGVSTRVKTGGIHASVRAATRRWSAARVPSSGRRRIHPPDTACGAPLKGGEPTPSAARSAPAAG